MNMKFFLGNSVSLVEGDTDCVLQILICDNHF